MNRRTTQAQGVRSAATETYLLVGEIASTAQRRDWVVQPFNQAALQQVAPLASGNPQTQGVELNKARRIGLIVSTAVFFEGGDIGIEQ